jgi:hypothetical protein
VKRSLVPYGALSCSIEYLSFIIILKGKLKRFGFVHEKKKLSVQLAILITDTSLGFG